MKKILIALISIFISMVIGTILASLINYFGYNPFIFLKTVHLF